MRSPVLWNDVPTSSSTTVAGSTGMYSTGSLGRCPKHGDGIIAGQEWRSVGGVSTLASSGAGRLRKWRGPADHPQPPRPGVAARNQRLRPAESARTPPTIASAEPGPHLRPRPPTGLIGVGEPLGDDALEPRHRRSDRELLGSQIARRSKE